MKKFVLTMTSVLVFAGLSFGAPKIHWPKLRHNAKPAQSEQAPKAPKAKKDHDWLWYKLHHQKKAKNSGASTSS